MAERTPRRPRALSVIRPLAAALTTLILMLAFAAAAHAEAPVLTATGGTLHWTKAPSTGTEWYVKETPCVLAGCLESAQTTTALELTPLWCPEGCAEQPLVHYKVREEKPKAGEYSNEVSIQYPAASTVGPLTLNLTGSEEAVEVVKAPSGTAKIHWANCTLGGSEGTCKYHDTAYPTTPFTPEAGYPWVAAEPRNSANGTIEGWTPRVKVKVTAAKPTVKTEPASAVTQTSATLNATVNPNGAEVTGCTLEYGPTTAYGSSAACTPAPGAGTTTVSVSAAIGFLAEGSVYHFRVAATNAAGTSQGTDATLTTLVKEEASAHVAVIVEENRNRSEVIGSSSMPYLNGLASEYGETTEWHGVTHPSLPNYLALASGSTQGQSSDTCEPSFGGETIGSQLSKAGVGWKAYMEGLPSAGSTTCESGNYAKKHNPFAYFPSSNGSHVVPGSQYSTDLSGGALPSFVWYTPDLCNDGHNCANGTVDASLKSILTPLLASKWYAENGTVIVTYDESNTGNEIEGNRVATVVINQNAKGRTLTANGNHYGTLATIEDLYKVPRLGSASGATTLAPLLEGSMVTAVDGGGWNSEAAINDFAGAVKYVRSAYTNYNSDTQMALLAKAGVTLMPLFFEGGTMTELDTTAHVETVTTWCKRYCKGGTYWAGKTDLGASTIELVNEPGNPNLHGGEPQGETSKKAYADLTAKTHAALAAITPTPRLLVSYDGGFEGDQYGEYIFAHGAIADGLTVHPYGGHVERAKSAQGNRERVTRAHEHSTLPVYVTEVGWPTCGETGDSLNWTESEQATNITNFAKWARELGYVADFTSFNYADYSGNCYGIVQAAGSPHKLSFEALKHA